MKVLRWLRGLNGKWAHAGTMEESIHPSLGVIANVVLHRTRVYSTPILHISTQGRWEVQMERSTNKQHGGEHGVFQGESYLKIAPIGLKLHKFIPKMVSYTDFEQVFLFLNQNIMLKIHMWYFLKKKLNRWKLDMVPLLTTKPWNNRQTSPANECIFKFCIFKIHASAGDVLGYFKAWPHVKRSFMKIFLLQRLIYTVSRSLQLWGVGGRGKKMSFWDFTGLQLTTNKLCGWGCFNCAGQHN